MIYYAFLLWLAVIPGVYLLRKVYSMDKVEKESKGLLGKILVCSIVGFVVALVLELMLEEALDGLFVKQKLLYHFVDNFFCVALVEELCKFYAGKIPTWNNKEFDYRFDAVVYMVTSAVGFAVIENIQYCFDYGIVTALARAVLAVPGHVIYGVIMGYFYGKAKYCLVHNNKLEYRKNKRLAILIPVLFHGFYDFCLSVFNVFVFYIYVAYVIVIYSYAFDKQKKLAAEDAKIYDMDSNK